MGYTLMDSEFFAYVEKQNQVTNVTPFYYSCWLLVVPNPCWWLKSLNYDGVPERNFMTLDAAEHVSLLL